MWIAKREKTKIKNEIDLIYDYKSNVIRRKITMKTQFLTQDRTRIDPIAHWIIGFSSRKFEDDRWHSIINFSIFSQQNLTFKHSSDMEISLEVKGSKRFKDCGV